MDFLPVYWCYTQWGVAQSLGAGNESKLINHKRFRWTAMPGNEWDPFPYGFLYTADSGIELSNLNLGGDGNNV